jgi:hypothetical protein
VIMLYRSATFLQCKKLTSVFFRYQYSTDKKYSTGGQGA